MVNIGEVNKLRVLRVKEFGAFLEGDKDLDILLPQSHMPEDIKENDFIDVFIYLDSDDKLLATTKTPYAKVGEFALLKVVEVNNFGAFLDWGLKKDLMVPFREQRCKLEEGKSYIVYIYVDEHTKRIAASTKLDKFLSNQRIVFTEGEEVELLIAEQTELGYKAIINNTKWGMLYQNELFRDLKIGERTTGFIKKVRLDNKIDLSLQKGGYDQISDFSQIILQKLEENNGILKVTDKSSPELIKDLFNMSKKNYKKAVGSLYKQKLILLEEDHIKLVKE
ncbi:MAG: S1 RNA-binding domain-containing protein [Rhodothermaceae bacterium]